MVAAALASAALGTRDRAGPAQATTMLRRLGADGMAVQDPADPEALRALLRYSLAAGEIAALEGAIRANLSSHNPFSGTHETLGLWLELSGAPADEIRAAYARAVELDPENAHALLGLGRLDADSDPAAALVYFDRAAEAAPDDPAAKLNSARALIALERSQEAEERFAKLLELHPHEGRAAAEYYRRAAELGQSGHSTAFDIADATFRAGTLEQAQ